MKVKSTMAKHETKEQIIIPEISGQPIADYQKNNYVIGDISGVPGIGELPPELIEILGLRALLRGNNAEKIILPHFSQKKLYKFKEEIIKILDLDKDKIIHGYYLNQSPPDKRLPYIYHRNYFPDLPINFPEQKKKLLNLVDNLVDKAQFAHILQELGFNKYLPPNTQIFKKPLESTKFPPDLIENFEERFHNKENFIIKAGLGASGTNMISFKYSKKKDQYHIQYNGGKFEISPNNIEEAKKHLYNAIPEIERKSNFYFLIQDLIDTEQFEEKSISFFITKNGIYFVVASENYTDGTMHQGNKQIDLDGKIIEKFAQIVVKLQELGYEGNIGFDLFLGQNNEIKIIEANPRFTAPITPIMLLWRLEKIGYIKQGWKFRLNQKFPISEAILQKNPYLIKPNNVNQLQKKGGGILAFGPELSSKVPIIIIGRDQQVIEDIKSKLSQTLK